MNAKLSYTYTYLIDYIDIHILREWRGSSLYYKGLMQINAFYYNKKKSVKLEIGNTKCFTHNCSLIIILYFYQDTKDIGVTLEAAAMV